MSNMPRGTFMQVMEKYTKSLKAFISAQGFGHYSKPNGGIPKTDLDQSVQTSLGKADTALQNFTETDPTVPAWAKASSKPSYTASEVGLGKVGNFKAVSTEASQGLSDTEKANARANIGAGTGNGTYSKPSGGIPKTDLASAVQTSLGKADSALQSETDPTVPAWAKQTSKPSYHSDEISDTNKTHRFATAEQLAQIGINKSNISSVQNDVAELKKKAVKIYTYHVNPNESDPEDAVTYLDDATGLTPAKMGASSFSYGSWANAWFLPRPCVLKFDGTVDYYLNPNDYSKKVDGTASTIDSSNSTGNVMLEFPKIWVKRTDEGNGARTVSIAPVNVDDTYKCWSNINADNQEVDHFYLPAYNGTIHSNKMRSLSGVTLNATYAPNYTRAQEVTAATANNPSGKNMWYTETWADMCLVYDLLYLMGKSLDVQRTFGQGLSSGSETAMRAYVTGTHDAKGLFYGDISGTSTAVKVLGMENLWGCRWHAVAGLINDNGTLKVKMTYGVADGSSAIGYNPTGAGYLNYGSTYGTDGFVKKMQADNTMGYKIIETAGTDATYYCNYYYVNNRQSNYALLGGPSDHGSLCGFFVALGHGAGNAHWDIGGALSCRPQVG
ncbi:MAG: hypothetical protein IJ880_09995 [Bacilli bacterium]|nr:hypothetical protein [Bacilli bacterium]